MTPSNLPSLPGLTWSRHKKPGFSTRVASHVSGREVRLALMSYPLYEFEASYSGLSSASSPPAAQAGLGTSSLQSLMGFFLQLLGQAGVFLYTDPDDNAVAAQNIGVGDGVTQSFVMGRTLGGFNEPVCYVTAVNNVYLNGVNQGAPGPGWALTSPNVLAFATAPGAGVTITADFTFAFQCRFLDDQLDFEEFMSSLWKLDSLKFRSIKANTSTSGAVIPKWYTAYNIGSTAPYGFADFATEGGGNHYLWNGGTYSSGAAWLAAAGGAYGNSTGKYVTNSSGLLARVAANTLPFDYSPTSIGTCLGLLLEGSSTNLVEYSNLTSGWTNFSTMTVTANATTAPDGTFTAGLLTMANSGSAEYQNIQTPGGGGVVNGTNTFSVYLKAGTGRYISLQVYAGSSVKNCAAVFDLGAANAAATQTHSTADITVVSTSQTLTAEGFYRLSITFDSTVTDSGGFVGLNPCAAATGNTFGADGGITANVANLTFYAWGAQYEALPFASSLIATTSSTATRAADNLYIPWTSTTFAARVKATMTAEVDNGRLLGGSSGGLLYQAPGPNATSNNGSATLSIAVNAWASQNIVVVGGSPSGRLVSANGSAAATDSNALLSPPPSDIYLGVDSGGANPSAGHFAQVGLWNVAPTAAQAATLSSVA